MGIDIGFTEESLMKCKYALCRPYRKKLIGFYSEQEENDELRDYREVEKYINMFHLRQEEPTLYTSILNETRGEENRELWYWNEYWFGDYYKDKRKVKKLKPYIETKLSSKVLFEKMPKELREEWMQKIDREELISAWWNLPYEKHQTICKPCPIRPLDEDNCYIRFSNYPGMNSFRIGFLFTIAYAATFDEQKMKDALFCFPHIDRRKGELPKDKIEELYEMIEGTPINRGAELMFNAVLDMVESVKPPEVESNAQKIIIEDTPFVDEFVSKFIYREEPYSLEETRKVLPYFETIQELADWAIWETDHGGARSKILGFKERFDNLVKALRIADKYNLEVYVSY